MTLKTYRAQTMSDALAKVKHDLGRDAVILKTRNVRRGGLIGLLGGHRQWEITASPNADVPQRYEPVGLKDPPRVKKSVRTAAEPAKESVDLSAIPPINKQVTEIRGMVQALLNMQGEQEQGDLHAGLDPMRAHLLNQDVDKVVVDALLANLSSDLPEAHLLDEALVRRAVAARISAAIPVAPADEERPSDRAKVIVFIGPTGVGKTTTIAKLAANYKIRESKRVAILTIDTFRIAAVDQLRTYADILDTPLKVVLAADELRDAVAQLQDYDVILIDTAGRSQNNDARLGQLKEFLDAANADETHLVISATSNRAGVRNILDKFMPLGVNRLLITKLDEAAVFGTPLNVCFSTGTPLSFVTLGQDVPDDIAQGDPRFVAQCIMEGRLHGNR